MRWFLRITTVLTGVWCGARITVYRPVIERNLPGDAFLLFPAAWALVVLLVWARRGRVVPSLRAVALIGVLSAASVPTTWLQTAPADWERAVLVPFVSLQIFILGLLLPELLSREDFDWIVAALAGCLLVVSGFLFAVNVLGITHALGEPLPRMNERGGLLRYGVVFHRNPNAYLFQWMPAALLVLALRARPAVRPLWIAGCALVTVQMLLSFSRGSTAVLVLSLSPAVLHLLRGRSPRLRVGLAATAVATFVVGCAVFPSLRAYAMLGIGLNSRERIWADHLAHVWQAGKLWYGVGYFNYWTRDWWGPHNAYLATLVYYGVPGLAAYLGILADTVVDLVRRARRAPLGLDGRSLSALVGALLVWGVVEDSLSGPLTMPAFTFWLVVGWMRATRSRVVTSARPIPDAPGI